MTSDYTIDKMPEYAIIEIPIARLDEYRAALCAAWEEFHNQVAAGIGDPDADALYRSTRQSLDELCDAFDSVARAMKIAQGKEPA